MGRPVAAAAALLAGLLRASPSVRVLVTSQARLALGGERVDRLEPVCAAYGNS